MKNTTTTRYLGFRLDPNNPGKISSREVSEEVYFAVGRPIWRHQKKMQTQGKCALTDVHNLWKCDGDCELCEYQRLGHEERLDCEVSDPNGETCLSGDKLVCDAPTPESIALDRITLSRLLERLTELFPEAVKTGRCMVEDDLSVRKALEKLGISRSYYRYRLEKAEKQLCREFGISCISELFRK